MSPQLRALLWWVCNGGDMRGVTVRYSRINGIEKWWIVREAVQ